MRLTTLSSLLGAFLLASCMLPSAANAQDMSEYVGGMSADQVKTFLEVAGKVTCPCGCNEGTLVQCRVNDPGCGTSKRMLAMAATLIKGGQDASTVVTALAQPAPAAPSRKPAAQPVAQKSGEPEIGDAPVLGPKDAEVQVVVWSDFQ